MAANKYFTENWIVAFGIVLILVTYYKYENDPAAKNNTFKEKETTSATEKKISSNSIEREIPRHLASDKNEEAEPEKTEKEVNMFNSAARFKKAESHAVGRRTLAQNSANISANTHSILQNTRWKLWARTQVVKTSDLTNSTDALAQVSNLSVVESTEEINLTEFNITKPVAVFDERLKRAGILTGVIKVQTADKEKLNAHLNNIHAEISDEFESIQTYFIRSQLKVFNLEELYENLKSQNYIISVELEIINGSYNKY